MTIWRKGHIPTYFFLTQLPQDSKQTFKQHIFGLFLMEHNFKLFASI